MEWFDKLKKGLSKTKDDISEKIEQVFTSHKEINDELFDELEEVMILSDIGASTTETIIDRLKEKIKAEKLTSSEEAKKALQDIIVEVMGKGTQNIKPEKLPAVYLVVGVNGVGKTTSIGKMAYYLKNNGYSVMLAAGDTFRAAAIDQLEIWGDRCHVDVVKHTEGSDPAAVIYDAIQSAKAKNIDVLICDTAGRLHNKKNLMEELKKINKVIEKEYSGAYKQTLLVMDATTGQNALSQAKEFIEASDVNGLILTKLDGTAKGGVVVAIANELNVPVKMIGIGEGIDDLQEFNPEAFVKAIIS